LTRSRIRSILVSCIVIMLIGLIAVSMSSRSIEFEGIPVVFLCAFIAVGIQWIVFIPSYIAQTEHYFDLSGTITYLSLTGFIFFTLNKIGSVDTRTLIIGILVGVWALRLGTFLFTRVKRDGFDRRFIELKPNFLRFFSVWNLQALWVFLTFAAGIAAMTSIEKSSIGIIEYFGLGLWIFGFMFEIISDRQKRKFRENLQNKDKFISTGLWAWSQHPNYFGEIVLWIGIAIIAAPVLEGWQLITLISPIFVFVLLTKISGVRLLDIGAKERWGQNPEYLTYISKTPVLFPNPFL